MPPAVAARGANPFDQFDVAVPVQAAAADPWAAFDGVPASAPVATQNQAVGRPGERFAPSPSAVPVAGQGEYRPAEPQHDPWAAFDGDPRYSAPGQPAAAAPALAGKGRDGWEAFDAPAAAAAAPGANPFDRFDPPAAHPGGEYGFAYAPDPAPGVPAAAGRVAGQPPPGQRSGMLANVAAGVAEGSGDVVSTAADPFGNLIGKPLAVGIVTAHDALAPYLGYDKFDPKTRAFLLNEQVPQVGSQVVNATARALNAPSPDDVVPATGPEQYARAGARGAAGMASMGTGAGVGSLVRGAALGAESGVGSQIASDIAPEGYKEVAGLVGGVAVPAGANAASRAATRIVGAPVNSLLDYGAPVVGRQNPLMDVAGQQFRTDLGAPLSASRSQANLAANKVRGLMSDPAAVQQALEAQPGAAPLATADGRQAGPTTAQLTRDPNLLAAERQAANAGPAAADFQARAAAQNDARVGAIRGIAGDGDPAALQGALQQRAAADAAAGDAQVQAVSQKAEADRAQAQAMLDAHKANLAQRATDAAGSIGGDLPAGSDSQVGSALRQPLVDSLAADNARESAVWKAVDPNGTLAADMSPVRAQAEQIVKGISPNDARPEGKEAALLTLAHGLPDVQSFADLQALRKRVTAGIREARMDPKADSQTVPRLSQLLDGVHEAMTGAVERSPMPDAAAPAGADAGSAAAGPAADAGAVPATGSAVFTPSGRRVDVRYGVREASDLTASQLPDGRPNPAYPQDLQPRDRTRAASQQQITRIANTLEPERLGASASTAEGAPVVGPDGIVESGNGRTLAIQQAHEQGGAQSQAYRDYLTSQGYDVSGMKAPVLVRERSTPLADHERAAFADDAGSNPVLGMSAAERAAADVKRLPGDTLNQWRGGDVTDAKNRDFVRSFAQHVLPESDHAGFMTDDGALSVEGASRVKNALTQHAYGDNALVSRLAENADPNMRAFGGAMADASGSMAKLRAAIDSGAVSRNSDLARPLTEAANLVAEARRTNTPLTEALAQRDAFAQRDPLVEPLLKAAYGDDLAGRISRPAMRDFLAHYADEAQQQAGLFGSNLSRADMVGEAAQKYGYEARRTASGTGVGDGTGLNQDGREARALAHGAPGQGNAGVGSAADVGSSSTISSTSASNAGSRNRAAINDAGSSGSGQPLTANFDRAAADRYAAARKVTLDQANTFKNAPGVGQVLKSGPTSGSFKAADSSVPTVIVRVGQAGADVAKAYLKAGGSPEALADAAAFSLRQAAMKDGVIDPAAYARWAKERASFLSQIPDAAQKFGAAADAAKAAREGGKTADALLKQAADAAQRTVNDAAAARADAVRDYQRSVAGKFLGDADPVRQVGSILSGKTAVADMEHLARLTANDADARAGLQRAVADHILRDLKGNSEGPTSTEGALKGDQLRTFLRNTGPALEKVMSPEQMRSLRSVADSLAQSSVKGGGGVADLGQHSAAASSFMRLVSHELFGPGLGGSIGATVGSLAGPAGTFIGSITGAAIGKAAQAAREAGLKNVDQLVSQALLNPALMRTLMAKATPTNRSALMGNLASQLGRLSLVTAQRGSFGQSDQQPERSLPRNSLLAPARGGSEPLQPVPRAGSASLNALMPLARSGVPSVRPQPSVR